MRRSGLSPLKTLGLALIAASLLLAGCGGGSRTPTGVETEQQTPGTGAQPGESAGPGGAEPGAQAAAALVNGEPISMDAYNRELTRFEAGYAALGWEVSDQGALSQQVLDLLVEDALIRQAAAAQGVSVSDEQVDAEINGMITEFGEDYYNNWLEANFYTVEEAREKIRMGLLTDALLPTVLASVPTTAEQIHARHILVGSEAEAQTVLQRLQAGEDFAAIAGEVSTDATTRDRGGDLGWFPRGGLLVPEVDAAAFALQPGQTSEIVQSAWGYHVVQVIETDPNREIAPETQELLRQQAIEEWLAGLRAGADIQQLVQTTP